MAGNWIWTIVGLFMAIGFGSLLWMFLNPWVAFPLVCVGVGGMLFMKDAISGVLFR